MSPLSVLVAVLSAAVGVAITFFIMKRLADGAREQLRDSFQALSAEALRGNSEAFLRLARTELERASTDAKVDLEQRQQAIGALLAPIRDTLAANDDKLQRIEKERVDSFARLEEEMKAVARASGELRAETVNLAKALNSSSARGSWGELQLRRVCELAGMLEHCDFVTQETVQSAAGALRPDVVVKLPANRTIVIDAKAPADAFLAAVACDDEEKRKELYARHAAQVRGRVDGLSRKQYWEQFEHAPDFVVLFLPNEAFYSVALQVDPSLMEHAVAQRVLIATPVSLIGLLKVVALGWRQEQIAESAQQVSELGRELYDRLRVLAEHFEKLGGNLQKTVESYNAAVGSVERSVFPSARRFQELGAAGPKPIGELKQVDVIPRALAAPDWTAPEENGGPTAGPTLPA